MAARVPVWPVQGSFRSVVLARMTPSYIPLVTLGGSSGSLPLAD
jgi:hypothetical protein